MRPLELLAVGFRPIRLALAWKICTVAVFLVGGPILSDEAVRAWQEPDEKPTPGGLVAATRWPARDTLSVDAVEPGDAADCLAGLRWEPSDFPVTLETARRGFGQWLVRFPSPRPSGDARVDLVAMEWYMPRDEAGQILTGPAVVVVHESGRNMPVGRLVARGLAGLGLHAFLLQLPGYGERSAELADDPEQFLGALKQGVADVRRARDAVAALPFVQPQRIGLQGTSLGGFVTATTCGLDDGYQRKFIFLAGGNLHDVVLKGQRDAAKVRQRLENAGFSEQQILDLARPVEPLRLAHRIDPATTWLYSGTKDDVVPPSCSLALATAAKLSAEHHIEMPVDHYSGITYLPKILGEISEVMQAIPLPNQP